MILKFMLEYEGEQNKNGGKSKMPKIIKAIVDALIEFVEDSLTPQESERLSRGEQVEIFISLSEVEQFLVMDPRENLLLVNNTLAREDTRHGLKLRVYAAIKDSDSPPYMMSIELIGDKDFLEFEAEFQEPLPLMAKAAGAG